MSSRRCLIPRTPWYVRVHSIDLTLTKKYLGADIMLANTLKDSFVKSGRPLGVSVGRQLYSGPTMYD